MAALQQRKLVHKQFNSPIGLYSDNNVKATLNRELKVLSNGTMGIDFDDSSKPTNLANSAVLRMLEEEELEKRHGHQSGGVKRVVWPPAEPSPSRTIPVHIQPSPARDDPNCFSQSQYPIDSNNNSTNNYNSSINNAATNVRQQSLTRSHDPSPNYLHQQSHDQYQSASPLQNKQPSPQYQLPPSQHYQQYEKPNEPMPQRYSSYDQPDSTYQAAIQQQQQMRQRSLSRSRQTPSRAFPNPDPSYLHINTPSYLLATQLQQQQQSQAQSNNKSSNCTVAFAGGVPVSSQKTKTPNSSLYNTSAPTQTQYDNVYNQNYVPNNENNDSYQQYHDQQQQSQNQLNYQKQHQPLISPVNNHQSGGGGGWSHVRSPTYRAPSLPSSYVDNNNQYYQQTQPQYYQHHQQQPHQQQQQYYDADENDYYHQQSEERYQQQQQPQQHQSQLQEQQQQVSFTTRQPSPGCMTLRNEAPITQRSPPIYTADPAAASFGGGANMRGDQKWPPQEYKAQSEIDNEARRKLALGPVFRPKRVQKDYSQFFNQHALNSTYPGYRAPPGTQHHA